MQEMMDEIIKAEAEAEKIVKQAGEQAHQLRDSVEKEISEALKKAKEDAQNLIHEKTEQTRRETEKEYKEAVHKAEKENREFLNRHAENVHHIIQAIVKLIITPEYDRE